ncbi:MAG: glutamate-1-semialdehyde 2,1-aminomutase [Limnochordaceae bacterium]|nr:glutamate-1-semialdehyde 2,1-aminomutase [Limnochordaceae bacterium]
MPGGVNSPVRAFRAVGGTPVFAARGEGPYVWDVSGRRYVDLVQSWGALILGHAHPAVVEAVQRAAASGTSFGMPTTAEVELAELIASALPSVEMVRLVNSGTEAVMSAVRLSRAATGRRYVVKFEGCYHGHSDAMLVKAGSGAALYSPGGGAAATGAGEAAVAPASPGVSPGAAGETLLARYNHLEDVEALFSRWGQEIAAVIVEPVAANMGVVLPKPGFLEGLRAITRRNGSLLIFDEVITGFRVGWSGAQGRFGVQPDLTCLGKIMGGGLPAGAYAGRRELMELVAPQGPVYQAGTLSGNPIAVAAGLATLRELQREEGVYERLEARARRLADGLRQAAKEAGACVSVVQVGAMLGLSFRAQAPQDFSEAQEGDAGAYARFFHAMLERGVHLAPAMLEAIFLSTAHDERVTGEVTEAAREAFAAAAG